RILDHRRNENRQYQSGNQAKNGVRPGEGHDCQADVLGEEQCCSLRVNWLEAGPFWVHLESPGHTLCQLQVRYWMELPASSSIWRTMPSTSESVLAPIRVFTSFWLSTSTSLSTLMGSPAEVVEAGRLVCAGTALEVSMTGAIL